MSPPSWTDYLSDLANNWSTTSATLVIAVPWAVLLAYALYYFAFKRPAQMSRRAMGPFVTFYTLLTDGASAGYDKPLMGLFHPALLKGAVERGLIRAMTRCLCARFGKVVRIPRETVCLKRGGMQVNCIALVDFERAKEVTCQLSWITRIPSVKSSNATAQRVEEVDGIGMAPLSSFHVTSFHIEPRTRDRFDVLKYLCLDDFEPFAERFVENIFAKPPLPAVSAMVPALREKYDADGGKQLEETVQKVVRAAGGLADGGEVDATLMEKRILSGNKTSDTTSSSSGSPPEEDASVIDGIEMTYMVCGAVRHMEVHVRITLIGLQCFVSRYEVRVRPDSRRQVIVDKDSGSTTVVA